MIMPDVQVARTYTVIHTPRGTALAEGLTIDEAIEAADTWEDNGHTCRIIEEVK